MQRRDVMGWTQMGVRFDVEAMGGSEFAVHMGGWQWGYYTLDREQKALVPQAYGDTVTIPLLDERMAALVALDATATRTRDVEVTQ